MTLNVIYRSESGSSIEETNMIPGGTGAGSSVSSGHRKLSAAMSMPVYPSYAAPIYFNPINKPSEVGSQKNKLEVTLINLFLPVFRTVKTAL